MSSKYIHCPANFLIGNLHAHLNLCLKDEISSLMYKNSLVYSSAHCNLNKPPEIFVPIPLFRGKGHFVWVPKPGFNHH